MVKTVEVNKDYVVVYKPHGLPTVPLKSSPEIQKTLLQEVCLEFPEVLEVKGLNPWEGGAIHRLDTATSGLVLFARNQDFYDFMQDLQKKGGFVKYYRADISNKAGLSLPAGISTYFRAYGKGRKLVKPELDIKRADSKIMYKTDIKTISNNEVFCTIERGFRHQIRSHLAYLGCPIVGDLLYGGDEDSYLHLECKGFSFTYEGKSVEIRL